MKFVVMCRVQGGITGERERRLTKGGQPVYFNTRKEAEDRSTELMSNADSRVGQTARFTYWAEVVDER